MKPALVLFAFFSLLSLCPARASDFIIGGEEVPDSSPIARSTVALVIGDAGDALCTGSIIDSDLIVTAAHCVAGGPSEVRIIFSPRLSFGHAPVQRLASSYVVHPDYDEGKMTPDQNDIAVIGFRGGLPSGYQINRLLGDSADLSRSAPVVLAGYGIDDAESRTGAGRLRQVTVQIANPTLGKTEVLIAQQEGQGACHGDSGGPAFLEMGGTLYLWGVTSRGYPNRSPDDCAHKSVYTKIMSQMTFVRKAATVLRSQ